MTEIPERTMTGDTKGAPGASDPIPPGTDREFALDWLRQFNDGRDISEAIVRLRMELTALRQAAAAKDAAKDPP